MSSNNPPEGGQPPRPSRRGGRNPAAQSQPSTQPSAFQQYPQTGQTAPAGSPSVPQSAFTGAFSVAPPGTAAGPQTPTAGSFQLPQAPWQAGSGPQSTMGAGSQPSPIGTPYQGSQITSADLMSRGSGGSASYGKNKKGQYLEVIYPSAFLEVKRENAKIHLQEPYQIYYKYETDPAPPSVEQWAIMIKKLDREGRKVFFVFGTTKFGPAVIKKLFPGIDTRTNTFQKLYQEFNTNMSQNLRRRIMWEDAFQLCLEWSRDFPNDFRVDNDIYAPNPANLDHTRHWIYDQITEATYKRVWGAVYDVIPWADNFDNKSSLQYWYLKTVTAGLLQKIGPIAAAEQKMNPGVKWAKRGVKWNMAREDRNGAYDFLELQGTDTRFRHIEMDTFKYASFLDENTGSTPGSGAVPKRRAEDLRAQNAFVSESPPPSPPRKTARHDSADIFGTPGRPGQETLFSSGRRSRHATPAAESGLIAATQGFAPSGSSARRQQIDPQLFTQGGYDPRGSTGRPFDVHSGSTPRASGAGGGSAYPYETDELRAARLERENRDYLARREAEMQEQHRQMMQQEIARLQQQYEQSSRRPGGYQRTGPASQQSGHSYGQRSPSLPPMVGDPPPAPSGIHHGSQEGSSTRRLSQTSSAFSNLSIGGETRPQDTQPGSRPTSSGRGEPSTRPTSGGRGSGGRGSGGRGSRRGAPPQLGTGLPGVSTRSGAQRESAYPLTPLQMQQAAAGIYSGTQGEQTSLSSATATRRTSQAGSFMAPTTASLTRSSSRRELRGGSSAGPSTAAGYTGSTRSSTRSRRAPISLAQEQEYNRHMEDRDRRRQAGQRVDSPEPELGRGYSTQDSFRSETYDDSLIQETETMGAEELTDLDDDRDRPHSPSERAAYYMNLHRASYN